MCRYCKDIKVTNEKSFTDKNGYIITNLSSYLEGLIVKFKGGNGNCFIVDSIIFKATRIWKLDSSDDAKSYIRYLDNELIVFVVEVNESGDYFVSKILFINDLIIGAKTSSAKIDNAKKQLDYHFSDEQFDCIANSQSYNDSNVYVFNVKPSQDEIERQKQIFHGGRMAKKELKKTRYK